MQPDPSLLMPIADRLTGPTDTGHYLAIYVLAHGEELCGYVKVFLAPPPDPWSRDAIMKCGGPSGASPADALASAERVARNRLRAAEPPYDIRHGLALAK